MTAEYLPVTLAGVIAHDRNPEARADIRVITRDQACYSIVEVLQHAIRDWNRFLDQRGI